MGAQGNTAAAGGTDFGTTLTNGIFNIGNTLAQGYADKASGKYALAGNANTAIPAPQQQYTPTLLQLPAQTASNLPPAPAPAINPTYLLLAGAAVVLIIAMKA